MILIAMPVLAAVFNESVTSNFAEHLSIFFGGMTATGVLAHAVNTFPTPKNPYGSWLLGVVQFAVGNKAAASNTFKGLDSVVQPIVKTP